MDSITWRPYEPSDLDHLETTPEELSIKDKIIPPSYTAIAGDKIIAAAGIVPYWKGTGEAWVIVCKDIRKYVGFPGALRRLLESLIEEYKFWRVQAPVRVDNPVTCRLLRWLRFIPEGLLHGYSPDGTDCFMYARLV